MLYNQTLIWRCPIPRPNIWNVRYILFILPILSYATVEVHVNFINLNVPILWAEYGIRPGRLSIVFPNTESPKESCLLILEAFGLGNWSLVLWEHKDYAGNSFKMAARGYLARRSRYTNTSGHKLAKPNRRKKLPPWDVSRSWWYFHRLCIWI